MGKKYSEITERHRQFIGRQHLFFVATAAPQGRVNLSPKGMDGLRVLGPNRVVWLNLTGSGNETAAHLLESERMTVMFCAFEGDPKILRLYGRARAYHPRDRHWAELLALFPASIGARQLIEMDVDLVQTSCGMGVPLFDYLGQRDQLDAWAKQRGPAGLAQYWAEKNRLSLDGKPTGIGGDSET